ncbi:MAG: glycerol-3-phosphate dehydrogenase/oxidase, partial [Terriglobales bacterium]
PWDFLIIGGGATGLGTALEAASRGYRTLLVEQSDFAKGTSSRSTKLIHGGVRYLQQGDVGLVLEALRERDALCRNAPHLVHPLALVVPAYHIWECPFYWMGLKLYDLLARSRMLGTTRALSASEARERIPTLRPDGLRGGILYYDAQFDDARLAVSLAETLVENGGVALNYMPVTSLVKSNGRVQGVVVRDAENGKDYELHARIVVNATGVFADALRRMDNPAAGDMIRPSQGIHLVLDKSFLPGKTALMVPRTDDGRVLFAIPWHDVVLMGTTDTEVREIALEPRPLEAEIDFILAHAARYLTRAPSRSDVLCAFAGLRPLVQKSKGEPTSAISRDHELLISRSGLVTITGGKWTTY